MSAIINVNDIRQILTEEITKMREGKTTPASLNAIVNATGKILSTVKMEMEYNKLIGKKPHIEFVSPSKEIENK